VKYYWYKVNKGEIMVNKVLALVRANAKALVAGVVVLAAGVGLDVPAEVQVGLVAVIVWLVPNK